MNTITHAFKAAGIQTPTQTQRIWTWLKDHQPQTAKQIAAAMNMPSASTLLSQMEKRRMVTSVKEFNRHTGFNTNRYSVCLKEYEYLPLPKAPKPEKATAEVFKVQFQPAEPVQHSTMKPGPAVAAPIEEFHPWVFPSAGTAKFNLDSLTIAEARSVYTQLHAMFGGV